MNQHRVLVVRALVVASLLLPVVAMPAAAVRVVSTTPVTGTSNVDTGIAPTATFSEAIQAATVVYSFLGPSNAVVPASMTYDAQRFTVTIRPTAPLAPSTRYALTIKATSLSGRTSKQASWWFTTAAEPPGNQPPTAALTMAPTSGVAPLAVTADASASTDDEGVSSYAFAWGDGTSTPPQATATATHTYASAGSFIPTVTVRDVAGASSTASATVSVSSPPTPVDNPPAASLSVAPASGVAPLDVTADASASTDDRGIASYAFTWGDGASTSPQASPTATHRYGSAGTFTVAATVTDTIGQASTTTRTVSVAAPPTVDSPPVAALSVTPSSGTAPLTVTADASTSTDDRGIASYAFSWGDGTSTEAQAGATATHTYGAAGSYTVMVTVMDTGGQATAAAKTVSVAAPSSPPPSLANTVVSLTFDDGTTGQDAAADLLASRGMRGTFYVNSGRVGFSEYLTQSQLATMQSQGHEIAGHTVSHLDLTTLSTEEAVRAVCDDRVALTGMGFTIKSFAYPFGASNSTVAQIVRDCGYNSARTVGGLSSPPYSCSGCPTGVTVPPANAYDIWTNVSVRSDTTLEILMSWVTQAENSQGGWVPLVFHHVCDGCATNAISLSQLAAFVDWLATRPPSTTVRTVDGVIGGALQGPPPPPPPPSGNLVQNPSLESASGTLPTCFQVGSYGTNTATWTRTNDARTGSFAQRVDITSYTSGDRKLVQKLDASTCAPAVTAGRTYRTSVWYKGAWSGSAFAAIVTYYRDASGVWRYWQTGPAAPPSATWAQATFTTLPVPSGATAISFGLALAGVGTLTTDDYEAYDGG